MNYRQIQSFAFSAGLIGITILFFWMLKDYVYPVFWAAVVAALMWPLQKKLVKLFKGKRSIAAGANVTIFVLIVLIPLAGLVSLIAQQAISVYQNFGNQETIDQLTTAMTEVQQWPIVKNSLGELDIAGQLNKWGAGASEFIYGIAVTSGQSTVTIIIQFFIMLYTLFYFVRDGDKMLKKLMYLLPLGDHYEKQMYEKFVSTTKATLKGTLVIGFIQGGIGTLAFLVSGVPGSLFWGIIMILFAIIPGIGASFVLFPAVIIMALLGNWWQAIVLLVALVVASTIDNVLRGPMVGKDIQMHPLLIFFATLGGLLTFGLSGVVIGPVITALLLSMWHIYEEKYKTNLNKAD